MIMAPGMDGVGECRDIQRHAICRQHCSGVILINRGRNGTRWAQGVVQIRSERGRGDISMRR